MTSYLTLGEYMTVPAVGDKAAAIQASTDQLLGRHPPEEMMKALAILDYATQEKEMADDIQRRFAERLKPEVRTRRGSGKRTAGPPREGERD